ncbi:TRAP transporter substrate-binding protein [Chelativorans sp. AA-79]|uniref:TRAP transporter substrate-binding protein n=1 Tax=Chelativorans sp. AA-79 TaxID=3028735 RepID=UPI0023F9D0AC|nr:TRAP transporter substrate-binding protein [Chelativorans sp. AA-79]WEX11043.1 TRAP transporter substrate-binding protein [Chelativorans sp. AA-79]
MKISRRTLLQMGSGLAAGSALAGMGGTGFAQTPQRWDMADEYGENALTGKASLYFIDELKKRIGDELDITYHGGGALGYRSVDHFDAVEDGAVPLAVTLATQLGGIDPLFDLTSLPFLVPTPDEAMRLWRIAKPEYARIFDEHNMVLLWAMPNPPSGIHGKRPIDAPDALKGLRIRTYDVNGTQTLVNAGAAPLQISWSDLVPQLSTGGIDAVLSSADGGVQLSIWDYLTDFTELNYAMGLFMAHVNKDAYESLSDSAKQAIQEVSDLTDEFNWKAMVATIEDSYGIMREHGMTVTQNPPAEVFDHLKAAGEGVHAAWVERVGDRGKAILDEFEKGRA